MAYTVKKTSSLDLDIASATKEEAACVYNNIMEFNRSFVPFTQDKTPILKNYVIKKNGGIIAGINAIIYCWKILYIDVLYVDEHHRGQSLGSTLLHKVEHEAKALGSTLAHLETLDFQAKGFYVKHGYETFGILEDCPKGHKCYALRKLL